MTRESLLEQKGALVAYLQSKVRAEDWHAVQDAASDIREVEAQLTLLASVAPMASETEREWPRRIG